MIEGNLSMLCFPSKKKSIPDFKFHVWNRVLIAYISSDLHSAECASVMN